MKPKEKVPEKIVNADHHKELLHIIRNIINLLLIILYVKLN